MADRRNFSMDSEAAKLLDENPDDNHSEIIRELIKEYYTVGNYDATEAAVKVRKRELRRQKEETRGELQEIDNELERLEEMEGDEGSAKTVSEIAAELQIGAAMATTDNPAIQKKAKEHGIDVDVLAEAVEENARKREREQFESLS